MKLSKIKSNPNNPRIIKDDKFKKLCDSIKALPKMMELRPIIVDENMIVQGGNMRLKALKELGYKDIPDTWVKQAKDFTEDELKEFIIKDNVGFGEWNWDQLANEWDTDKLIEWGLDIPDFAVSEGAEIDNSIYTKNIKAPVYEPKKEKPDITSCYDSTKMEELLKIVEQSNITNEERQFLINAANRFCVFNFEKIADYYSHSNEEVQSIMEKLALIIIDFDKAIENGFVKLSKAITDNISEEYE